MTEIALDKGDRVRIVRLQDGLIDGPEFPEIGDVGIVTDVNPNDPSMLLVELDGKPSILGALNEVFGMPPGWPLEASEVEVIA